MLFTLNRSQTLDPPRRDLASPILLESSNVSSFQKANDNLSASQPIMPESAPPTTLELDQSLLDAHEEAET